MVELSTIAVFLTAVLALFLSPGPNMAFVLSYGMSHGARGGFAVALGITAADLTLTLLTATGITAMIAAWPPSFDVLRYLGALYLLRLAFLAIRTPGKALIVEKEKVALKRVFGMAMLNSLLNPKALIFFMVFLPQFVVESRGQVALQLSILGGILSLAALIFNSVLGAFSGQIGAFMNRSPRAARVQSWVLGSVMFSLALRLAMMERGTTR